VSVIDGQTNTVTATVPVGAGPDGVTVNLDTTTVYTANNIDNTVSVLACG
jgi:DNA-binding beta-propeller fold protein YncE